MKLSKAQQEVIGDLKNGGVLIHITDEDPRWLLRLNGGYSLKCKTATAEKLLSLGIICETLDTTKYPNRKTYCISTEYTETNDERV